MVRSNLREISRVASIAQYRENNIPKRVIPYVLSSSRPGTVAVMAAVPLGTIIRHQT